jgi:organic hydroperoxide reductase OsmC/OhrA
MSMAAKTHLYRATVAWTGAAGGPTENYDSYSRDYDIRMEGKPALPGSADPGFRGDPARHNPEDLLVGALSSCHMLWYLHLCSAKGVKVVAYEDAAEGAMVEEPGNGRFTEVVLKPVVTITPDSDAERARSLHSRAHDECFIANSVNFPVRCEPDIRVAGAP